jgi:DNA-binding IclR family transcriptional regulator
MMDKAKGRKATSARTTGDGKSAAPRIKTRLSSVATAIRLLKAFTDGDAELGISTLSKRLGVSKSTVHRLATTLKSEGLLEQNPETENYRLGIALFTLGASVRRRMDISSEAKPLLLDLRRLTNENVHLAILDDSQVVYINDLVSAQAIRLRPHLGLSKPAFCTAEGLAMLAFKDDRTVDLALVGELRPRTPRTITDPVQIRRRLERVIAQGYVIEDEESEVGMRGVAAPIRSADGEVVAAVGVAGPSQRLSRTAIASYAPRVISTAEMISERLGYHPMALADAQ